jgi:small conductance mechanosensitive channel
MIKGVEIDFKIVVTIIIIFFGTLLISKIITRIINRYIQLKLKRGEVDLTNYNFFGHIATAVIYITGFAFAMIQIPQFKVIGQSMLAGAGVLSLVVGLASQQALSNIVSGILIVIFKPFRINDKITINTYTGFVEDINLRQVVIRDLENNRIIIPNSVISNGIITNANLNEDKVCKIIQIGIGYSSNIERALEIMKEEVLKHPLRVDNRTEDEIERNVEPVIARVVNLGESSVDLKVWAWALNSGDGFVMYCDLLQSIKKRFDAENIEIPFPQRSITLNQKIEK